VLKSEMTEAQEIFVTECPGAVIRVGLRETWRSPNPGWFQFDDQASPPTHNTQQTATTRNNPLINAAVVPGAV
jgi:hypothetical protein